MGHSQKNLSGVLTIPYYRHYNKNAGFRYTVIKEKFSKPAENKGSCDFCCKDNKMRMK